MVKGTVEYATFKFSDGSERELRIFKHKVYKDLQEGDVGALSYKGTRTKGESIRFVSFEKDSDLTSSSADEGRLPAAQSEQGQQKNRNLHKQP